MGVYVKKKSEIPILGLSYFYINNKKQTIGIRYRECFGELFYTFYYKNSNIFYFDFTYMFQTLKL